MLPWRMNSTEKLKLMVPLVLINLIIWGKIYKLNQQDKAEAELFDYDLYNLSKAQDPRPINETVSDKDEDIAIKQSFEAMISKEVADSSDAEEIHILPDNYYNTKNKLEEMGIVGKNEVVWCEGLPLRPGVKKDLKEFFKLKRQAQLVGWYNSKPLDDGGAYDLDLALFKLKGCSEYGARQLIEMGVDPEEFEWEVL